MVNACYTRNGVIHIKKSERSKPIKIMSEMYDLFPDFNFNDEEEVEDLFHDASYDASFLV